MIPEEAADRLARAYTTCKGNKCTFASECDGKSASCPMKEIGMTIRAQQNEIEMLRSVINALRYIMDGVHEYIEDLEEVNKNYFDLVKAFQMGYRPKKPTRKRRPINVRKYNRGRFRMKKTLVDIDGDERYAPKPEPKQPYPPVVVI